MSATQFDALASVVDYPMFVVTCARGSERAGCLVGFATQCSIDPPRFLACISVVNHTERVARQADVLAVHLLGSNQKELAELFGARTGDDVDKFDQCRWEPGPSGVPLLVDCPNRFVGRVLDRFGMGDHSGYLLDIADTGAAADLEAGVFEPLTFQHVRDVEPGHRT
ncbi:MAG: flavin reductase family protein [Actinomycetota bacterium]|nr:flavin reductase family protein [Actinomycetota bacterium]